MKKNILVATPSLGSGGVEVSLIRFIKELSNDKNLSITLLLLKKEGIYLKDIPSGIKILEVKYDKEIYSYNNKKEDISKFNFIDKIKFTIYRLKLRYYLKKNNWENYYKEILKHTTNVIGDYDLAIDWHGYGHFITAVVADKINAKKKASWIHDEKNDWLDKIDFWINKYNKFFCVSKSCIDTALKYHSVLKNKIEVFYNLIDYENIREKALQNIENSYNKNKLNIITVGRLEWQKGYEISIDTAIKLSENKIDFCWYVIGTGSQEQELKKMVRMNKLDNRFKFLGVKKNPFPYIRNADLYVQTTRHEGYGLAIAEAKVLGTIPIATDLNCIKEQITDGENGFLCKLDAEEFADKIIEVSKNKKLMDDIKKNLAKENFDYTNEFKKLYELMED